MLWYVPCVVRVAVDSLGLIVIVIVAVVVGAIGSLSISLCVCVWFSLLSLAMSGFRGVVLWKKKEGKMWRRVSDPHPSIHHLHAERQAIPSKILPSGHLSVWPCQSSVRHPKQIGWCHSELHVTATAPPMLDLPLSHHLSRRKKTTMVLMMIVLYDH